MKGYREEIWDRLGRDSFTNEALDNMPALALDRANRIVISVLREVVAPFVNRSEDPDETVSLTLSDGREIIEVPARKFKSKEKLLGIRLCKAFGKIDPEYEYNAVADIAQLNNPNSVLFGDTVVESGRGNQGMFPSRVLYSSSYSVRNKVDLTRKLTHNALSGQGTMWDRKEGKHRQSLFETEYVIPGTVFPSFLTLRDPSPEMMYHFLRTLEETSYGAQTSITGSNIRNHVIGILSCRVEPAITSYTVSEEMGRLHGRTLSELTSNDLIKEVKELILKYFQSYADNSKAVFLNEEKTSDFLKYIKSLKEDEVSDIYGQLAKDSSDLWNFVFNARTERKKGTKSLETG